MSDLADLYQYWGNDLVLGPTGDIAPAFRSDRTSQRILRRLLTNPGGGDYPWQPGYGAGLLTKIGQNLDLGHMRALIVGQIALEPTVARNPPPQVTMTPFRGGVSISVLYYDQTGSGIPLSFNLAATPPTGPSQPPMGLEAPTAPSPHQLPPPESAHR
jgi:hypothetical protein